MSPEIQTWLVRAAALGPLLAAVVWLGLVRIPLLRRIAGGAVFLLAHAAAWAVFWAAYRGDLPAWRGLQAGLLEATVAAVGEVAVLFAILRADPPGRPATPAAVVGLGVSASALVFLSYADSILVAALFIPVPTVAAWLAGRAGSGGERETGLLTLVAADVAALAGLSLLFDRGSIEVSADPGATVALSLILGAAAVKAGAVPGTGTWRLGASGSPAAPLAAAIRAQGVALAAITSLVVAEARGLEGVAIAAGAAAVLCGALAVLASVPSAAISRITGAGAAVLFLAVGLGGAVGARGFLVLFPAFLIAMGAADLLVGGDPSREGARPVWAWLGAAAILVAAGSLVGVPPSGGFPGTWLTLSLATVRGDPIPVAAAGGVALGLGLGAVAAVAVVRWARPRVVPAVAGSVAALLLLYMGLQPVRLGIGWWLRVDQELGLPRVLDSAGAPDVPALGGLRFAALVVLAAVLVGVVVVLGRGVREAASEYAPVIGWRPSLPEMPRWAAAVRDSGLVVGLALALEIAVVVLVVRLILLGAARGYL